MARKRKGVLGIDKQNPEQVAEKADKIIAGLTNNADLPKPPVTVSDLENETAALRKATTDRLAAKSIYDRLVIEEQQAAEIVYGSLQKQVSYINIEANGNTAIIVGAGVDLEKEAVSINDLERVANLRLKEAKGTSQIKTLFDALAGAKSYKVEISTDVTDDDSWAEALLTISSRGNVLVGLTSGQRIWVRVAGVGKKGLGPWSDVATRIVP